MIARSPLSSRARVLAGSRIVDIAREAALHGAVDLAFGVPDSPAPDFLKAAAVEAVRGDVNQYVNSDGIAALREEIAGKIRRRAQVEIDPETEITVTCGASEGVFAALLAVIDPGDEVVLFEPCYENYFSIAALAGAAPRCVKLHVPDFRFDEEEMAAAFNERTKAVILNTPHNPTGKVFNDVEMRFIADLCRRWGVVCITDEIYEHFTYDGHDHRSMLDLPGMRDLTIAVTALSKTYAVTGWRVGYVVAPPELTACIRKVHESMTVTAPAPLQTAGIAALRAPESYYRRLASEHQGRRDRLLRLLEDLRFVCHVPEGALYIMTDISALGPWDDVAFSRFLIREVGVAAVPGSVFYAGEGGGRLLRFCFGKSDRTLAAAEERLRSLPGQLALHGAGTRVGRALPARDV